MEIEEPMRDYTKRPMTPEEEEDHWFEVECMQMAEYGDERYAWLRNPLPCLRHEDVNPSGFKGSLPQSEVQHIPDIHRAVSRRRIPDPCEV